MYHSITFGDKNTWDDWHLIPTSRPVINPPKVKTNIVEIPGTDGTLDLSTALSGRPIYNNRTGSFEFYVENGFRNWAEHFSDIMAYLHGRTMRVVLEDDPEYYYEGKLSVDAWKSNKERSSIIIDYDLYPYKKEINSDNEQWLWDTFNFETGIIRYYKNLPVDGILEVTVIGSIMPSVPTIITSDNGISVTFNDKRYNLTKGINVINEIVLQNGENILTFSGKGTITIEHNGGIL